MRIRMVALSLIPGAAHIGLGRTIQGLLYFLVFALCLNAALMAPFLSPDPDLRLRCALGAGVLWLVSFVDAVRIAGLVKKPICAGGDGFSAAAPKAPEAPAAGSR
ncbi:MAG: hypothetical protein HY293_23035 [Planctomycetes bacterium]|nr:hypothetical protein [Planctomycetota bacterium]